ncbi:MAG TPA: hypothetical protein VHC22_13400 [Pirellulales bacterium]|nr:hypothetical protein [Pirellulales bacterium]
MDDQFEQHDESTPDATGDTVETVKTPLEQRQELLAHHVRLVARKLSHALFVFGSQGGLGKSRTILGTLRDEGVEPVLINSHITALALYSTLYTYRTEEILFFDDCDSMYSSMVHLGLLRSALWGTPRIVTYGSSQLPDNLPPSFETTARFVFAANVIPKKNDAFKAVLSRCDVFDLSATNEEVIEMMRTLASNGFQGITADEANTIIDYMSDHCEDRQLSLRLLGPSLRKLKYARETGIDWRPLIKSQLQTLGKKIEATKRLDNRAKDFRLLEVVLRKFPDSVNEQQAEWCKATGKSRASFYRALGRYRDEHGD